MAITLSPSRSHGNMENGKPNVTKTVAANITAKLSSDFKRFSSGSVMFLSTQASFIVPDTKEDGKVGVDAGGTNIEVKFGDRSWVVNISDIVSAVHDADVAYRQEYPRD